METRPDGLWDLTIESTMGAQPARVALATHDGMLNGSLSGSFGVVDFQGGSISGRDLAWIAQVEQPLPMALSFTATIDCDSMSGDVQLGTLGKARFSAERVTDPGDRERAPIEYLWEDIRAQGLTSFVAELD